MSKYPLCDRAGLQIWAHGFIQAEDVERLLANAPVVYGYRNYNSYHAGGPGPDDTRTARLLMIEPIHQDSAESLLRELTDWFGKPEANIKLSTLIDRAKRLLEEE